MFDSHQISWSKVDRCMKTFSFVSCFKVCPAKVILGRDTYVIDMTSALSSAVKCRWYPSLALSFCTAKSSPGCIAFDPTQLRQEGTEEGWSHSFYSFGGFALSCSIKFLLQDYLQPVFPSNPHDLNKLFEHCDMFDSHLHDNFSWKWAINQHGWSQNCATVRQWSPASASTLSLFGRIIGTCLVPQRGHKSQGFLVASVAFCDIFSYPGISSTRSAHNVSLQVSLCQKSVDQKQQNWHAAVFLHFPNVQVL